MKRKKYVIISVLVAAVVVYSSSLHAQWSADTKISVQDSAASLNENMGQCLAVSGDSVHALWWDKNADSTSVFYRHSFDGGVTWSVTAHLGGIVNSIVDFPCIAVSGATVHIAWRNMINGTSTTYYKRSLDGGNTWGANISLGTWYWWPSLTCDGQKVFIALNDSHPNNTEVYCRRSTDNGTTWDTVVHQISNATGRSEDPSIAASSGCVHLVWNDNRTGIMQTWYRHSFDNGVTWGAETQLTNAPLFSYCPMIIATIGYVDVVRADRDASNNFHIMYKRSLDSGMTWSSEQELSNNGTSSGYPVIKRDGENVHVVWWDFSGDLKYCHSSDGGVTWGSAQSLVTYAANKPTEPFIALSATMLHVIWLDSREGHPEVYYKNTKTQASVRMVNSLLNLIEISPNPASQNATLKIGVAQHLEDVKINFYDAAGRLLSMQNIGALNEGILSIPLLLPQISGIAFLRITSGSDVIGTGKILLTR